MFCNGNYSNVTICFVTVHSPHTLLQNKNVTKPQPYIPLPHQRYMDTVEIYHRTPPTFFESDGFVTMNDFAHVATISFVTEVPGSILEFCYRITNSVDEYWSQEFCNGTEPVTFGGVSFVTTLHGERFRSSSVGDCFVTGGKTHEVAGFGFKEVAAT